MSKIASVVRAARLKKSLSQTQLSRKLGWASGQYLSNIERGQCALPTKYFGRVSKLLGIPRNHLERAHVQDYRTRMGF